MNLELAHLWILQAYADSVWASPRTRALVRIALAKLEALALIERARQDLA